jgi:hypothetical protein
MSVHARVSAYADSMADPADLCAYCTTAVLSSDEKPEHVIPQRAWGRRSPFAQCAPRAMSGRGVRSISHSWLTSCYASTAAWLTSPTLGVERPAA